MYKLYYKSNNATTSINELKKTFEMYTGYYVSKPNFIDLLKEYGYEIYPNDTSDCNIKEDIKEDLINPIEETSKLPKNPIQKERPKSNGPDSYREPIE
jgi:hypothetical protein